MKLWETYRAVGTGLLIVGLTVQASPVAWAQLETADPVLHAAVTALLQSDPDCQKDPELAATIRQMAEATATDPRERVGVTHEVAAIHREGIDIGTIIPKDAVHEAAREGFGKMQEQARQGLESLPPEERQRAELMMGEATRQFEAWESGEKYVPSEAMKQEAEKMFQEWAKDASPQEVEFARAEFSHWSAGELTGPGGEFGPGHEMMGPGGPGQEMGGPGGMPSLEHMQAMVDAGQMTPEQLTMAKEYMQQGGFEGNVGPGAGGFEAYGPGGGTEYQGMNPQEAFEHWAGTEGQSFSPEQVEQYREMAEQYRPENQNYDNLQQQHFDQYQPPPGGTPPPPPEVLVATHDHDGNGIPDEYHYDTNGDGIADHAHSTPH